MEREAKNSCFFYWFMTMAFHNPFLFYKYNNGFRIFLTARYLILFFLFSYYYFLFREPPGYIL